MLNTLVKIGEQLLEGQEEWGKITTEPKVRENKKSRWVCPILFDCIDKKIEFLTEEMEIFYPDSSPVKFRYVNTGLWGPRGKKCALSVEHKNFSMLKETLFGKENSKTPPMMQAIAELDPNLVNTELYQALNDIFHSLSSKKDQLDLSRLNKEFKLPANEEIVMYYSKVRSGQIQNGSITNLRDLEGFDEFFTRKFCSQEKARKGLDYIKGTHSDQITTPAFATRYNIHKIFQTTTKNFAQDFSDFSENFNASPSTISALDKASSYVLNNWQVRIAGIPHIIVPSFLNRQLNNFDLEETELFIDRSAEMLFKAQELDTAIKKELPESSPFWLNYIGFESDGNSFKIISHIKDVNSVHLKNIIDTFNKTQVEFRRYIGGNYGFNLQSVYRMIPVREEKKNDVLVIFKDLLEQRPIDADKLYNHFIQLILCHRFERNNAFTNILPTGSFDFAVKDAVFKYSALIYALKKLNLINMENSELKSTEMPEKDKTEFQKRVESFFEKMEYGEQEKAIFYLGRVLNSVATAQYKKGHESKPVLNKVNFNGMDAQAITRLSLDLAEKTIQYNIHQNTEWDFARFREHFNPKNWTLPPEQNVFYLMAGYSFGLTQY